MRSVLMMGTQSVVLQKAQTDQMDPGETRISKALIMSISGQRDTQFTLSGVCCLEVSWRFPGGSFKSEATQSGLGWIDPLTMSCQTVE